MPIQCCRNLRRLMGSQILLFVAPPSTRSRTRGGHTCPERRWPLYSMRNKLRKRRPRYIFFVYLLCLFQDQHSISHSASGWVTEVPCHNHGVRRVTKQMPQDRKKRARSAHQPRNAPLAAWPLGRTLNLYLLDLRWSRLRHNDLQDTV